MCSASNWSPSISPVSRSDSVLWLTLPQSLQTFAFNLKSSNCPYILDVNADCVREECFLTLKGTGPFSFNERGSCTRLCRGRVWRVIRGHGGSQRWWCAHLTGQSCEAGTKHKRDRAASIWMTHLSRTDKNSLHRNTCEPPQTHPANNHLQTARDSLTYHLSQAAELLRAQTKLTVIKRGFHANKKAMKVNRTRLVPYVFGASEVTFRHH